MREREQDYGMRQMWALHMMLRTVKNIKSPLSLKTARAKWCGSTGGITVPTGAVPSFRDLDDLHP